MIPLTTVRADCGHFTDISIEEEQRGEVVRCDACSRLDGGGELGDSGSQTRNPARASVNENPSPSFDSPEIVVEDAQRAHRVRR